MASKGRGFRVETIEGFEVLVGKGDSDNDRLTFRVGEPHDLWLHVSGTPGSHVIVRLAHAEGQAVVVRVALAAVSYTHLTLPTKRIV